jgi:hypothetical protein
MFPVRVQERVVEGRFLGIVLRIPEPLVNYFTKFARENAIDSSGKAGT